MPNVLIFESDLEFANALQTELNSRSCDVSIVEDASVGLQQASSEPPDLILLCTELPRMNGFSVCNRLKRDPKLQGVPVIIMSANASEETFQQHRNLPKKRADDYVHKPISFDELMPRIEKLMPLGSNGAAAQPEQATGGDASGAEGDHGAVAEEAVLLDDELELEDVEEFEVEELDVTPESESAEAAPEQDDDLIAEEALDALMDEPEVVPAEPESTEPEALEPEQAQPQAAPSAPPPRRSSPPPPRQSSLPPESPQTGAVQADLQAARDTIAELEAALAKQKQEDEQLHQELDEARARLASGASGPKAKDILDLREALNKKDKELLDLRDQLTRRDKELLGANDSALELERKNADLAEQLVELDKKLHSAERAQSAAVQDRDQASKRAEEFKRKLEKTAQELEQGRAQLQDASSARDQLQAELEGSRGEAQRLQSELEAARAELAELGQKSQEQIQMLKDARGGLEKRLSEAEEQLDQSQLQATEALEKLDRERAAVSSVTDALSSALEKLREISQ